MAAIASARSGPRLRTAVSWMRLSMPVASRAAQRLRTAFTVGGTPVETPLVERVA